MMRAAAAACLALVVAGAAPARETAAPTLAQLVGQKLVVTMNGTAPSGSLLRRVRRGDVGGVIVHRFNFGSSTQLRRITRTLQGAAVAAGRPKLLIAVDQEGGRVKTVPWAPPALAPAQMVSPGWGSPAAIPTARSCGSPRPGAGWRRASSRSAELFASACR
jgi:beta-N-acetylhexosaminidase